MIKVVNKYKHTPTKNDIYIGRGSPLGNPYPISDVLTRKMVLEYYKTYFQMECSNLYSPLRQEVQRILDLVKQGQEVNLVCFCKPKDCHGDYIKEMIEDAIRRE